MAYNRRDLIGHWVRKTQPAQRMCQHACCRGYRVHPKNYPVILPDRLLRTASDADLATHFNKRSGESAKDETARAQILYEMERRDQAERRRSDRQAAYRARLVSRKFERAEAVETAWLDAERATKGNMLNRAGREAGVNERTLFTGSEAQARRYASDELREHWRSHPRPTAAMFRGKDTRLHDQATAPRRKQYGVRQPAVLRSAHGSERRAA